MTGRRDRAAGHGDSPGPLGERRRSLSPVTAEPRRQPSPVTAEPRRRTLGTMKLSAFLLPLVVLLAGGCSSHENPLAPRSGPDSVASYRVTFTSTWSAATNPQDFPASAHFSGLIGATHDARVTFWSAGTLASPGIQAMAELGSKSPLDSEVAAAIAAGTARDTLSGGSISPSPGSVTLDFEIALSHPRVTLVSMIAPSPDWFVGVSGLPLLAGDRWVDSVVVVLRGWDAGTDDGTTYIAPNAPSAPHVPIAPLVDGPFLVGGHVPPLGTFTFVRR